MAVIASGMMSSENEVAERHLRSCERFGAAVATEELYLSGGNPMKRRPGLRFARPAIYRFAFTA